MWLCNSSLSINNDKYKTSYQYDKNEHKCLRNTINEGFSSVQDLMNESRFNNAVNFCQNAMLQRLSSYPSSGWLLYYW